MNKMIPTQFKIALDEVTAAKNSIGPADIQRRRIRVAIAALKTVLEMLE